MINAKIAQLVEHNLAKVRVAGSSPVFRSLLNAKVAQLVEHDLPKVGVAGSSPVFRSSRRTSFSMRLFFNFKSYVIFEKFPDFLIVFQKMLEFLLFFLFFIVTCE